MFFKNRHIEKLLEKRCLVEAEISNSKKRIAEIKKLKKSKHKKINEVRNKLIVLLEAKVILLQDKRKDVIADLGMETSTTFKE
jgi:hypothetical protein